MCFTVQRRLGHLLCPMQSQTNNYSFYRIFMSRYMCPYINCSDYVNSIIYSFDLIGYCLVEPRIVG